MWEKAKECDVLELIEMFFANLEINSQYISHGEIQMGIANDKGELTANAKELWRGYITEKIKSMGELPSTVLVLKEDNKIVAFGVLELSEDGDKPYGIICDMLVDPNLRGRGVGTELFNEALSWFNKNGVKDIYLESGVNNHRVHKYFSHLGFEVVSHIFKLKL